MLLFVLNLHIHTSTYLQEGNETPVFHSSRWQVWHCYQILFWKREWDVEILFVARQYGRSGVSSVLHLFYRGLSRPRYRGQLPCINFMSVATKVSDDNYSNKLAYFVNSISLNRVNENDMNKVTYLKYHI